VSCDDPAPLASFTVLHNIGRNGGRPREARVGRCQQGQTLAVRWLAAGIPLTLLLDIADPTPHNSFRIASHEAAMRPGGRVSPLFEGAASLVDVSPW
jgi:hypothetical protein